MGLYYIPRDDYLMHHGVKGQKWGVRNDPERTGRRRSGLTTANDVNQKRGLTKGQKTALKVGAGVAAAGLAIGAGVALHKSGMGKQVVSAGMKMLKPATKVKIANTAWKHSAKESGKVFKAAERAYKKGVIKANVNMAKKAAGQYIKDSPKIAGRAVKKVANETENGVWLGVKGATKDIVNREHISNIVKDGIKKGIDTTAKAAIAGGIGLGAKSVMRGRQPNREEMSGWMTRNPNKE